MHFLEVLFPDPRNEEPSTGGTICPGVMPTDLRLRRRIA
jgi:hypothetical protein